MVEEAGNRRERDKSGWAQELAATLKGAWPQVRQYASDVMVETRKVTRPGKQEVYGTTVMVVLTTFLFGIYFYFCDLAFGKAMTHVLSYLRHRG